MKADSTTYGPFLQSQNKASVLKHKAGAKTDPKIVDSRLIKNKPSGASPDYKLDLSKPLSTPPVPTLDLVKPKLPEATEARKPEIKKPEIRKPSEVSFDNVEDNSIKRPAIIFIKGLDVFSSPLTSERGYAGVGKMADAIAGSRVYGWDQHAEIINYIKKFERQRPVVLVGHSFGGDTALEVAEELNSLDHQFRKVDLLITIDAVGVDNDIIPQNVKEHLNIFGESNFLLNDGPHIARRNELTQVKNILSAFDHTELDDDKEIQFEVVSRIQKAIGNL